MKYNVDDAINILRRTPLVLDTLLRGLPETWIRQNEGENTWSPYDVLGHLIHGERTDWIARIKITLSESGEKKYKVFDRFAQFEESKGKTFENLLDEFKEVRDNNLRFLRDLNLSEEDLEKTGIHPSFGTVKLRNLLSTWAVHDLDHIFQIVRVMSYQYKDEVGPWIQYMRILNSLQPH